jgi:ketosteroid isomerase-like protein
MVEQQASDTLEPFLDELRGALTAIANGNPEPMKALCSHTDTISQCGFWGGVESGWDEVSERWEWVASQFVPGSGEVTSDTAFLTVSGDMAYGVFIERWRGRFKGRPEPAELIIRATLIFRREDGEWKAVHRHGDNAVEKASPS